MTNDLGTMLRTSLHERADDVEPTPELWQQVQRRVARRRAMPLLVWTAAGVAAAVTAVAVVPGLVDRMDEGFVIDPAQSPTAPASPGEVARGPVAAAPLTHYVAVVDGRLVLRGLDGSEQVLWQGESEVRTVAVRPGSTPEDLTVAFVTAAEGMLDLRLLSAAGEEALSLGAGPGAVTPGPVWSPDGRTVAVASGGDAGSGLVIVDIQDLREGDADLSRVPLAGVEEPGTGRRDPSALRLQDWASGGDGEILWFTSLGELRRAPIGRVGDGWDVGVLERADGDAYVVDIATGADGTQYRLLAGGTSSGDAEGGGLALEFDNERLTFDGLATAEPSAAWMTAVDGGAILGSGSDAYLVLGDREGDSDIRPVAVSYAAWVPAGSAPATDPEPDPDPSTAAGSSSYRYVVVDELGRVAVHTAAGDEREVIVDEQLWHSTAVAVTDVAVRPGSAPGDVSGVVLLATDDRPELAWFRAAGGATATARMEGATGLGEGDTEQRDAPTWSPDGRHIAWVEPDGNGGWTLRTVGVADDGPTTADAGFGVDVQGDRPRVADWMWESSGDGATRGSILIVGAGGTYTVAIERQGDGALAVGETVAMASHGEEGEVVDAGFRDGELVSLWAVGGDVRVRQPGVADALLPLAPPADLGELDLDVSRHVVAVTYRGPAATFVVDRDGDVEPLGVEAHGFDLVR